MRIVYFIILFTFVCNYAKNQGLTNSLADMNNVLGAKNLLPNNAASQTINGVTFTVNDDGSVTANGTATAETYFKVSDDAPITKGDYILNGCPTGGAIGTYNIYLEGTGITTIRDTGNGADYSFASDVYADCYINIGNGYTVNNLVLKPMLRPASIEDDTYVPYSMTNRELTDNYSKTTVRVISVKNTSGTWGDSIKNVLDAFRALTDIPDNDKVYIYDLQLSYMHLNVINAEYREFSSVRSNVKTYNCVGSNNNPKHILNAKIIDSGSSVELNRFSFEDSSLTNISSYTSQGSTSIHFLQLHNV